MTTTAETHNCPTFEDDCPVCEERYRQYLLALGDLIGKARALADTPPRGGWGGGFSLFRVNLADRFGYCNTSDLLYDLEHAILRDLGLDDDRR